MVRSHISPSVISFFLVSSNMDISAGRKLFAGSKNDPRSRELSSRVEFA